jgi:hypothetical protein
VTGLSYTEASTTEEPDAGRAFICRRQTICTSGTVRGVPGNRHSYRGEKRRNNMQDRYSGDVGDFGKFSLLRYLFNEPRYRIGVLWYLFPNESHNGDGGHVEYLRNRGFLDCDKGLCERLSSIVSGNRSVAALEEARLLPVNTVYFSEPLDFHKKFPSQTQEDRQQRQRGRAQWFSKALVEISNCNIAFLDPDNGLQIPSCPKTAQLKSGKFAYYSEISKLTKDKDVTVIYHHLGRNGTHAAQISGRAAELRQHVDPSDTIFAVRYRPYSPRAYFIVAGKSEEDVMREKVLSFMRSAYGNHWDCYCEEKGL